MCPSFGHFRPSHGKCFFFDRWGSIVNHSYAYSAPIQFVARQCSTTFLQVRLLYSLSRGEASSISHVDGIVVSSPLSACWWVFRISSFSSLIISHRAATSSSIGHRTLEYTINYTLQFNTPPRKAQGSLFAYSS